MAAHARSLSSDHHDALALHQPAQPRAEIPPLLLAEVVAFAQQRVAAGDGTAALAAIDARCPALVAAYQLGFLPPTWGDALGADARKLLRGRRLSGAVIAPAFDEAGNVVDLLAIHQRSTGGSYVGIHDQPRGLIAPAITTAHQDIIVTDSLRLAARRFAAGHTDALLVRGLADAESNVGRLAAAGVRRVLVRARSNAEAIAEALRAAGIAVAVVSAHEQSDGVGFDAIPVPVAPIPAMDEPTEVVAASIALPPEAQEPEVAAAIVAPTLSMVAHDQQSERATFTIGPATYVVEVPHDATTTRLEVVTRHAGQVHREVVDLAVEAARARYSGNAAMRCGISASAIVGQLPLLLEAVRKMAIAAGSAADHDADAVQVDGPERDAALALLRAPDVLDQMAGDLTTLGWVGEADAKRVLLLTAISRKLPEPLWAINTASSDLIGGHGLDVIAALTPPEDLIHVSRLSPAALAYQGPGALHHKLLVIDEATTLTSEVVLALRVLKQRGALSQAIVPRHNLSGSSRTQTIEVRGPIAVLSATSGKMDRQFIAACCQVPIDESAEQTARVLIAERQRFTTPDGGIDQEQRADILRRHHAAQRLIARRPVVIPFADRIQFPATTLRSRHHQNRFLALVAVSALLHQHQRLSDRGHVVADTRDFDLAVSLSSAAGIGVEQDHDLGCPATTLLSALRRAGLSTFTIDDARALLPHWGRTSFRSAVADLIAHDHASADEGGRGRLARYRLAGDAKARAPSITLSPPAKLVGWSPVGQLPTSQLIPLSERDKGAVG